MSASSRVRAHDPPRLSVVIDDLVELPVLAPLMHRDRIDLIVEQCRDDGWVHFQILPGCPTGRATLPAGSRALAEVRLPRGAASVQNSIIRDPTATEGTERMPVEDVKKATAADTKAGMTVAELGALVQSALRAGATGSEVVEVTTVGLTRLRIKTAKVAITRTTTADE